MEDALLERIERYVKGKMPEAESHTFEREMQSDQQLTETVKAYGLAVRSLQGHGLKQDLKQYHRELIKDTRTLKKNTWSWVAGVAASAVLIFTAIYFLWLKPSDAEQLFASNFESYPNVVTTRTQGTTEFGLAMESYSQRDFEKACDLFEQIPPNDPNYGNALFYSGISYLAKNNNQQAIDAFNNLMVIDTLYQQQVRWYLGLALLRGGRFEQTKNQLSEIGSGDYKYHEAQKLMLRLE